MSVRESLANDLPEQTPVTPEDDKKFSFKAVAGAAAGGYVLAVFLSHLSPASEVSTAEQYLQAEYIGTGGCLGNTDYGLDKNATVTVGKDPISGHETFAITPANVNLPVMRLMLNAQVATSDGVENIFEVTDHNPVTEQLFAACE